MSHSLAVVNYPETPDDFLIELHKSKLLNEEQLKQVELDFRDQPNDSQGLADLLIRRRWLTTYQVEQLFFGKGEMLCWGQYRILDCIARGGMAEVYKAQHLLMNRIVALKVLTKSSLATDPLQEIQFSARLQHPNIVTAFDAGVEHGRTFLVMEYVDGLNLHRLTQTTKRIPVGLVCDFVRQAARALQCAHTMGLLHRDVKPANFVVTLQPSSVTENLSSLSAMTEMLVWPLPQGVEPIVKLLDLGIAQLMSEKSGELLMGTPDYLAPEIAENQDNADERSDLYSLGCTFYQLLTGTIPFPADSWPETVLKHRFDDPLPLAHWREDVPLEVERILRRLLEKSPEERYPNAQELLDDLERWLARDGEGEDQLATLSPPQLSPLTEEKIPEKRESPEKQEVWDRQGNGIGTWRENLPLILALMLGVLLVSREVWIRLPSKPTQPVAEKKAPAPIFGDVEPPSSSFVVESQNQTFADLRDAIEAAQDEDVVTIVSEDPIELGPIRIQDKKLTLRTALNQTVELIFHPRESDNPWQPMISTNRSLMLENLHLTYDAVKQNVVASAPLIRCTGAALRLQNCQISAKDHVSPITCQNVHNVELIDCVLSAKATALSVELSGLAQGKVTWTGCEADLRSATGALISIWSTSVSRAPEQIQVSMENNQVFAGRIFAFTSISSESSIVISARNNSLKHEQALVSFSGVPKAFPWKRVLNWQGMGNRQPSTGAAVRIAGQTVESSLASFP